MGCFQSADGMLARAEKCSGQVCKQSGLLRKTREKKKGKEKGGGGDSDILERFFFRKRKQQAAEKKVVLWGRQKYHLDFGTFSSLNLSFHSTLV